MPGYWNRPETGQRERREPASWTSQGGGQDRGGRPGSGGGGDTGPSQAAIESARRANEAAEARRQAAQEASQALHAQQMQEMAKGMQAAGQIGGGLSGGTYTKGPVVYPKSFYTHEGWAEVQKRGWSDKLVDHEIQGKTPSEWILAGDDPSVEGGLSLKDVGGRLQTLPEGVIYSSNIGDPERGYGGFKRVSNFTGDNRDGGPGSYGMWRSGYGGGYGGSGYAAGMPYIPGAQEGMGYQAPGFLPAETHAWMVNTNLPQYAARGGIMSLRR